MPAHTFLTASARFTLCTGVYAFVRVALMLSVPIIIMAAITASM